MEELLLYVLGVLLIAGVVGIITILVLATSKPRPRTESERFYRSAGTEKPQLLPSVLEDATADLTVVVPAYNESERLPTMLDETITHLEQVKKENPGFKYEILIVDDGSSDDTSKVALAFGEHNKHVDLRVLTLEKNRKKGGAVTQGMLSSSGKYILFADADGATKFSDFTIVDRELKKVQTEDGFGVAIGSRAHLVRTEAVVKRSLVRNFLMHSFHKVVYVLGIRSIADTQCGFKMFTRKSAQRIFANMHVEGWIFDIEVLLLAQYFGMPIVEIPVSWHEVDGSKISLAKDSIQMATDLLVIRFNYLFGIWKVRDPLAKVKRN